MLKYRDQGLYMKPHVSIPADTGMVTNQACAFSFSEEVLYQKVAHSDVQDVAHSGSFRCSNIAGTRPAHETQCKHSGCYCTGLQPDFRF